MPDPYWTKVGEDAARDKAERERYTVRQHKTNDDGARKKKYICAQCKAETLEPWMIRTRRAAPRCPSCGSLAYEPKTAEAKTDITDLRDFRKSFDDSGKGYGEGHFVIDTK